MTINTDVQSTSGREPEEIKEKVEGAAREVKGMVHGAAEQIKEKARGAAGEVAGRVREMKRFTPDKNVVRTSLLMSGATLASIMIASAMRRKNPLEAFSTMGEELRFVGRKRRAIHPGKVLAGIGSIIGGSMVLALLNHKLGRRVGHRPIMRGALAALGAIGMDSLLMGPSYVGKLVQAIGPAGTAIKYGSVGSAYSLGCRRGEKEGGEREVESIGYEGETTRVEPLYSGAEVGTVAGSPEHPQPLV